MPVPNMMLSILPYNCNYCVMMFLGMKHVSEVAKEQNIQLTEIMKGNAHRDPVWQSLEVNDPIFVNGIGHGNNGIFTGDSDGNFPIFSTTDCSVLAGRIVYLHSCYTANELGPAIIKVGGIAFGGYNIAWTWMSLSGWLVDPYTEFLAEAFFKASNVFPIALIEGETVARAYQRCIVAYNRWIEIWETERFMNIYAAEAIKWLIWDRDGLTVLGDLNAIIRSEPQEKVFLTMTSSPPINLTIDNQEYAVPSIIEIAGGIHLFKVPLVVERDGLLYGFRQWSDGNTKPERSMWLASDQAIGIIYEQVTAHILAVNSEYITQIEFSIDGITLSTPSLITLEEKSYIIKVPQFQKKDEITCCFDRWEDGSKDVERTFALTSDMNITAYYRPLENYELTVDSFWDNTSIEVPMFIDKTDQPGRQVTIPGKFVLPEGFHLLEVFGGIYEKPISGCAMNFRAWSDGNTKYKRDVTITENTRLAVYYYLFLGRIFIDARDSKGKTLVIPFSFNNEQLTTPKYFRYMSFGAYTINVPEQVIVNAKTYKFKIWEDGSASLSRTFSFYNTLEKRLIAYYAEEGVSTHVLSIGSTPIENVPVTVNEVLDGLTLTHISLEGGEHIIAVPEEIKT